MTVSYHPREMKRVIANYPTHRKGDCKLTSSKGTECAVNNNRTNFFHHSLSDFLKLRLRTRREINNRVFSGFLSVYYPTPPQGLSAELENYSVYIVHIQPRDGVCSRSWIRPSCCCWPDTICYCVMAREKQPAWESTSSTGEEWLDTVGGLCHPVWKRATMVYPANTERGKFDIAKALEDVF